MKKENWEKYLKYFLDQELLPDFPYTLDIRVVGEEAYVNVKVVIDTSRFHYMSPNFDKYYRDDAEFLSETIETILNKASKRAYLNSMEYSHKNYEWINQASKLIRAFTEDYFSEINEDQKIEFEGFTKLDTRPELVINFVKKNADWRRDKDFYESLHRNLDVLDLYVSIESDS